VPVPPVLVPVPPVLVPVPPVLVPVPPVLVPVPPVLVPVPPVLVPVPPVLVPVPPVLVPVPPVLVLKCKSNSQTVVALRESCQLSPRPAHSILSAITTPHPLDPVQKNLIAVIFFHPHAIKLLNLKILAKIVAIT
jgi:hypothetical protein